MSMEIKKDTPLVSSPEDLLEKVRTFDNEQELPSIVEFIADKNTSIEFLSRLADLINAECQSKELNPLTRDLYSEMRTAIKDRLVKLPPSDQRFLGKFKSPNESIEKRTSKNFTGR